MAMSARSQSDDGMYEINVTPLVDVMLVLLIIFMISTPIMVYQGLKIELPQAKNVEELSHVTLKLSVLSDGTLLLDEKPTNLEAVRGAIGKIRDAKLNLDALIAADASVAHGKVMAVSDFLRTHGITQVGFVTHMAVKRPEAKQ